MLIKELNLQDSSNLLKTYEQIDKIPTDVTNTILNEIKTKFNINNVDSDNHCIPKMYWLPKMHKVPTKCRFIVAAPKCSIKPLTKAVTSAFKLFYGQIEAYNNKSRYFSGVNTFWVIQSSKQITKAIKQLNKRGYAKSINTFDFSTLYTKIPHDKLIFVLNSIIDFCFKGGPCKFIAITKYGAKWVEDNSNYDICFDVGKMKEAVSYVLNNCYFTVGDKVFRQIIGIPMGSDPAPFFANFFLYFYERQWLLNLKKIDLIKARKFCNTFRFIDDLNVLNGCGEFEQHIPEIYPAELILNRENETDSEASFLDLYIKIVNNKFTFSLYDKRDDFPFTIVRMPFSDSSIPSSVFYSSIGAEVLRIARATSENKSFFESCNIIVQRMIEQGAKKPKVCNILVKFFNRHVNDFQHVANDSKSLVNSIFT